MPLMRDELPLGKDTPEPPADTTPLVPVPPSTSADLLNAPVPPQTQRVLTRSQSPSLLSGELFLRVHAQNELTDAMEDVLTQASDPPADISSTEVELMLQQIEELHQAFRTEHSWLVSHWPPSHLDHAYFTRKVGANESKLVLKAKRLLGRLKDQLNESTQPGGSTGPATRTRSRLPELSVPSFTGETSKWPDFKAMFKSVIGNRTDLSDLEKFQYLKGAVSGDASELINNLAPIDSSYEGAWLLLTARYENKRLIIKSHLERVLALKPMTKRQPSSLLKMVNIINTTTQALKTFTQETNNDCLMVTLVVSLLDSDTRERWENSLVSNNDFPTLGQLTDFLITRARTLESLDSSSRPNENRPTTTQGRSSVPHRASSNNATQQTPASSSTAPQATPQATQPSQYRSAYPCDCCGQTHFIVSCTQFRGHSLAQRVQVVKDKSLCCNCLGRHNLRKCNNKRHCKTCNGSHHTMLHGADLSRVFGTPNSQSQTAQDAPAASTSDATPSA